MREDTVARGYAETLFELAERHQGARVFGNGIELAASLMEDARVREFLVTPRISAAAKKAALDRGLGGQVPAMLLRFLKVVIDRGRQRLIPRISQAYALLLDRRLGRRHVEVSVARPLDEEALKEVAARLSGAAGVTVIPDVRVRPAILGGIVIRDGDTVYDGSLKRRLDGMRRKLMATGLPTPSPAR